MEPSRFMATVKVGPKGQVVIPKEIREMFAINAGDSLVIMADSTRGIALHRVDVMERIADAVFEGEGAAALPGERAENRARFAAAVKDVAGGGKGKRGKKP